MNPMKKICFKLSIIHGKNSSLSTQSGSWVAEPRPKRLAGKTAGTLLLHGQDEIPSKRVVFIYNSFPRILTI
jgi:hypothetical protein